MATKCEDEATVAVVNSEEDVFANPELLLEATKFDDSNVSHDVELKMKPVLLKNPLKTYSCSSCESGVSCTGSPNQATLTLKTRRPKGKQLKISFFYYCICIMRYEEGNCYIQQNEKEANLAIQLQI